MSRERHAEDCIACRLEALGMTDDQVEFFTEALQLALEVGAAAGRGFLKDKRTLPTLPEMTAMIDATSELWSKRFGSPHQVPESDEVRQHSTKGQQQ